MPANSKLVVFIYLFEILTASSVAALPPDPFRGFGLDLLNLHNLPVKRHGPKASAIQVVVVFNVCELALENFAVIREGNPDGVDFGFFHNF